MIVPSRCCRSSASHWSSHFPPWSRNSTNEPPLGPGARFALKSGAEVAVLAGIWLIEEVISSEDHEPRPPREKQSAPLD